jgi:tetratricopeptide (TPR) repeat protein
MSTYEAMARANSGWLAWRRGDLALAKEESLAAWNSWQVYDDKYPMQWAALWLLIAIAMNEEMLQSAVEYARQLFRPNQQLVPPELSTVIEEGLANFEMGDTTAAQQRFRQALDLASQLRYL